MPNDLRHRTPSRPVEDLRSVEYARIIDVVCEGEIEGLVDGDKSIYFDGTPWRDADSVDDSGVITEGTYNFDDALIEKRYGTQGQEFLPGFTSVESGTAVGVQIKKSDTSPYVITIGSASSNLIDNKEGNTVNPTSINLSMSVPTLYRQDSETGDLSGTAVKYEIHLRSNSTNPLDYVKQNIGFSLNSVPVSSLQTLATTSTSAVGVYGVLLWYEPTNPVYNEDEQYEIAVPVSITVRIEYSPAGAGTWTEISTIDLTGSDIYYSIEENGFLYETNSGAFNVEGLDAASYDIRVSKVWSSLGPGDGSIYIGHLSEYVPSTTITIRGKSTSNYTRTHSVDLTQSNLNAEPWDIKVVRLTADSTSTSLKNDLYISSYTKVLDQRLSYPNTAVFGLEFDAKQFSSLPARSYDLKLLKVKIPTNYNPRTRAYTGIWDGTFTVAWTDNPAWCFYDLVTNKRYGLGKFISESLVDKAALYTIAQYCDVQVVTGNIDSNGVGATEPRFTCNLYLQTREEAYKVLTNMASIFRGMLYWSNNLLTVIQDSSQDVTSQFTNADVIDGLFNYEGSAEKVRHNVILVSWNDPANGYKQSIEYVEDTISVSARGIVEKQIVAVGCTSRGQARRVGLWMLYTELNETEVVTFKTGLEGSQVAPGKIIRTSDQHRAGVRHGGRITASTSSTVTLDSDLMVDSGSTLTNVLPNGVLYDTTPTAGTYTAGSAIPVTPDFPVEVPYDITNVVTHKVGFNPVIVSRLSGAAFSANGLTLFLTDDDTAAIYQHSVSTAFDLSSTVVYTGENYSFGFLDGSLSGVEFSPNGLTMFLIGNITDSIYQYALGTAWSLSGTITLSTTYDVSTWQTMPQSIAFSSDGLTIFLVGHLGDTVDQFALGTAWDLTGTKIYTTSYTTAGQDTVPNDISFSSDGLRMFIVGSTGDSVYQYTLGTAWDLSGVVNYNSAYDVSAQDVYPTTLLFNDTGTKMYVGGTSNSDFHEYEISDIGSKPDAQSIWVTSSTAVSPEEWRVISVTEDSPGLYSISALEYNSSKYDSIEGGLRLEQRQVSITDANTQAGVTNVVMTEALYLITVITPASKIIVNWTAPKNAVSYEIRYRKDDDNSLTLNTREPEVEILNTSSGTYYVEIVAYNSIGVASLPVEVNIETLSLSAPPADVQNFEINVMGDTSYLYWDKVADLDLEYYEMRFQSVLTGANWGNSTPILGRISASTTSISTQTLIGTYLIKAVDTTGNYSANATLIATNITSLDKFNVVSTITEDPAFSGDLGTTPFIDISAENSSSEAIRFNNDGKKMYALTFGVTPITIKQYTLNTAYSVASAVWDGATTTLDISSETSSPAGFVLGNSGTKLYVLDDIGNKVYQYTLSIAYTVSSATYDSVSFTTGIAETTTTALDIRPDGTELFIASWDNAATPYIYSFPMSTAWDISTASATTVFMDTWGNLDTISPLLSNQKTSFSSEFTWITHFVFSADGTTMIVTGNDQFIRSYALSTPFDMVTISYDGDGSRLDFSTVNPAIDAAIFNAAGSELNVLSSISGTSTTITLLTLSTANDLSTAAFGRALSNTGNVLQLVDPNGISTAVYGFANSLDLGAIFTSLITPSFTVTGINVDNFLSGWVTLASVETLAGTNSSQYSVTLEIRTTKDNPAGSPTWTSWKTVYVGDYSARAFEFRLRLTSLETNVTPSVSALSISVDMPDRVYGKEDVAVTGTGVVTYSPAFNGPSDAGASPAVAIAAQNLQTGDYFVITNKTTAGFTITFKDSTDTTLVASRTFDYVTKGYGYVTT